MQTYPGLVTFFYQFFLHFKEGKIWCLVSSLADSPFGFLVLQIFPVERRENFHSRLCKTVQQPVAVVQESICAPKGFFVWLLVYSLCRCREYGPWCGASAAGVNSNYLSGALRSLGSGAYTNPTTTHQASCFTREPVKLLML